MLDETESETEHNNYEGDQQKKKKTLNEVKLAENISKNPQSFLEVSPMKKEVIFSHRLQDYAYE